VSKQFTAMGVLILQARHRLAVSDRVCSYLPGCPGQWRAITILANSESTGILSISTTLARLALASG
jgi:hypothetical protein